MAEIIVHAGMAKTRGPNIQGWLLREPELLAEHGIQLLAATRHTYGDSLESPLLEPYEAGKLNADQVAIAWHASGFSPAIAQRFVRDLGVFAERYEKLLVTAETFSMFFYRLDEPFLTALDVLAQEHTVRVAHFVRPQHTAIEALWRQGGFRRRPSPSAAVVESAETMHHLRTKTGVNERAPHVDFAVRPFRSDLLVGSSAVSDFAWNFLGIETSWPDARDNTELSLELVNRLRQAPDGLFFDGRAELYPRRQVRAAAAYVRLPAAPETTRSRDVLRAYCREVFEADNQELIRQLGWATTDFVPPTTLRDWSLSELDDLWTPKDSPTELAQLFDELHARLEAIETLRSDTSAVPPHLSGDAVAE